MGAYPFGSAALTFSRSTHAGRQELALEAAEGLHGPVYRSALRSSISVDWTTQPYAQGAWSSWDRYGVAYRLLRRPAGRWWFAGDRLSRSGGWQHGAFESARTPVTGLHARALQHG